MRAWFVPVFLGILLNVSLFAWMPILSHTRRLERIEEISNPIFLSAGIPSRLDTRFSEDRPVPPEPEPPAKDPEPIRPEREPPSDPPQTHREAPVPEPEMHAGLRSETKLTPPPPKAMPRKQSARAPAAVPVPSSAETTPSGDEGLGPPAEHSAAGPAEFELGDVDRVPEIVRRLEPAYPFIARRRNISGKVVVRILVDPDGNVRNPKIVEAQPEGIFESSVLEAIREWRFKPGYYQGRAVPTWVIIPIRFKLSA